MKYYITVDGGTTNTRVYLVRDGVVVDNRKIAVGSKNAEAKSALSKALCAEIANIILQNGLKESDVTAIIASGMITCEFGLYKIDHVVAPAGIAEIKAGGVSVMLPEIASVPFFFIGGVKTVGEALSECDMMRGEETELMGILGEQVDSVFVLPGSHSKIVRIDSEGRIVEFKTMLTGEMIAAIASGTILASSVDLSLSDFDGEALLDGYRYAEEHGLNEALFKVRVARNLFGKNEIYAYSFFLGAILKDEISSIISMPERQVVVGGRAQIKRATAHILRAASDKRVLELDDATVDTSVVRGAIRIFEYGR